MKKRIILSVINDLSTEQRVHKVCLFLERMGCEVLLVGRRQRKSTSLSPRSYKFKRMFLLFEKGPLFYAEYNIRLFLFLLFKKADVLVSNDLDTLAPNFFISKIKNTKLVYDSHEYFTEVPELRGRKFKQGAWKVIERFILPKIKYAYTVNQSIADLYRQNYGIEMKVVRNFPKHNYVNGMKSKSDLGIPADKKIILSQGSVNLERGIKEAVYAMPFINNAVLLIIGGGDILDEVKNLVKELDLSDKVIFTGKIPFEELKQYTPLADIGISLDRDTNINYRFSLPNKIFDYVHAGVPVLASNLPEIKKIFSKYEIGEMIENHEARHIAEKMNRMLNDTDKRKIWKENAKIAAEELCWENEEKELMKIYQQVI